MDELIFDNYPQQPHGGKLVDRVLTGKKRDEELSRAKTMPFIMVDLEAVITIEMIATGVLSPNEGFMNKADYDSVLENGRLQNGVVWPVPLSFAPIGDVNDTVVTSLAIGDEVALVDDSKEPVAILNVTDIFNYDKDKRAHYVFGTTDRNHPGVDAIYRRMGDVSLAGPIKLLQRADWGPFEKLRTEPKDMWHRFYEERKFRSVAGFITGANPLHRGHEYIHKNILEEVDGLLIQPLVEMAKREYTRHEFRMLSYQSVMDTYYPKGRPVLSPLRVTYIFAGPRETILHALIMKNYGCTHALIGRDHAGIGDYYDKYASHTIFKDFPPEELGIDVRLYYEVFYCTRCDNPATMQTCPHDERFRINISGTGIRELLRHGVLPPKEIVRPESARIAIQGVQPKGIDADNQSIAPAGKTIKSIFPYYLDTSGLGGGKREKQLTVDELTNRDLESAVLDARTNANRIYKEVYDAYAYAGDTNRTLQPEWVADARSAMQHQQEMVINDLEEKVQQAPESASDEYMYQDRSEAEKERDVARKILADIPPAIRVEDIAYRTWNPMPYRRYRSGEDPEETEAKDKATAGEKK